MLPNVNTKTASELADDLCEAFASAKFIPPKPSHSEYCHEIAQLKSETNEAFKLYQKYRGAYFKDVYFHCRRNLHRAIKRYKQTLKDGAVSKLKFQVFIFIYTGQRTIATTHHQSSPVFIDYFPSGL